MADNFVVTAVNQTQELDASGHLVDAVNVIFELANGAGMGSVTVPLTTDWADVAEAAVRDQAAKMTGLLAL